MTDTRNVLWIMVDQLRWDYLSCYGHKTIDTPHLDGLAARGVRFNRSYIQSPFCGPSRMSSYTGRYCRSHGATWNGFPLRVGEITLGDHLRPLGVTTALVGKTHMIPDLEGMARLGIDPNSEVGKRVAECGFDVFERDDGQHPYGPVGGNSEYDAYLERLGYKGENPWEDWANSAEGEEGEILSGWLMKYANLPARIPEEHSETPYMTGRAMQFMEAAGDNPWCCHLSYIKPHWPYIVPAPYHNMYGPDDVQPVIRSDAEKQTDHPVFRAYQNTRICQTMSHPSVRERVIPAYMGLIKQIDDQMGRLFAFMEERKLFDNTMIVFTSDHGDYLGDHWMGEKDLFHDPSVRVPLIVYDPRKEADAARGSVSEDLVEAIDLAPTFLEFFGGEPKPHILEGRSLAPILHGQKTEWRDFAISEFDYSTRYARQHLDVSQEDARLVMLCDKRWKYVYCEKFRPMLFDLENDPQELNDLGGFPDYEHIRKMMEERLFTWSRQHHTRTTLAADRINKMAYSEPPGVHIGFWDEQQHDDYFGGSFADRPLGDPPVDERIQREQASVDALYRRLGKQS
ncbi:MAG: alkaline phosphatase family protein [Beijerinckiaceae bacterium]|jgi:arylsulfatase A-like enzyme|nr:alkaline phosphatase family protein [Beijerinckiaceae bacterium]